MAHTEVRYLIKAYNGKNDLDTNNADKAYHYHLKGYTVWRGYKKSWMSQADWDKKPCTFGWKEK
jgi:hypothetical protein